MPIAEPGARAVGIAVVGILGNRSERKAALRQRRGVREAERHACDRAQVERRDVEERRSRQRRVGRNGLEQRRQRDPDARVAGVFLVASVQQCQALAVDERGLDVQCVELSLQREIQRRQVDEARAAADRALRIERNERRLCADSDASRIRARTARRTESPRTAATRRSPRNPAYAACGPSWATEGGQGEGGRARPAPVRAAGTRRGAARRPRPRRGTDLRKRDRSQHSDAVGDPFAMRGRAKGCAGRRGEHRHRLTAP